MKKNGMKALSVLVASFMGAQSSFAAYKVAEDEVKGSNPVEFQNFTGQAVNPSSVASVLGIGDFLAGNPNAQVVSFNSKYRVVRLRDDKSKLFSADVLQILEGAQVNTIRNVRRILAGYMQSAYSYTQSDALALATFITYYNALNNNNTEYIDKKYSPVVADTLKKTGVGLSTNYNDWQGKAQIVIPLINDALGGGVDALELGNKDVQNSLKSEPDKGIAERTAINDMQQKQVDQEKQAAADNKTIADNKSAQLQAENKNLEAQKQAAKTPEEKAAIQKKIDANNAQQKEVAKQQQDATTAQQKAVADQKQVDQNKQDVKKDQNAQKQAASTPNKTEQKNQSQPQSTQNQNQTPAQQNKPAKSQSPQQTPAKQEKAKSDDKSKSKDQTPVTPQAMQQTIDEQQQTINRNEKVENNHFFYLKKVRYYNGTYKDSSLVMVDAKAHKVMKVSPLNTISGNRFDIFDKGIVVIARSNPKSEISHLTLIDKTSLEIVTVGDEDIYANGMVKIEGSDIYAIYLKDKDYYLGHFSQDLKLLSSSTVAVDKDTFLSFYEGKIYLTNSSGDMVILNQKDLTLDPEQVS